MPSLFTASFLHSMRERKRLSQEFALGGNDKMTKEYLSKVENSHQHPTHSRAAELIKNFEVDYKDLFYPGKFGWTAEAITLMEEVSHCLRYEEEDPSLLEKVQTLIHQMENSPHFTSEAPKQFYLSSKAALMERQGKPLQEVLAITQKALAVTYPEYKDKDFEANVLLFEECDLIHTRAKAYKSNGDLATAIALLERTLDGLAQTVSDDRDRERKQMPIMLTLAQCHFEEGRYQKVLDICNQGIPLSKLRNYGYHIADFAYYKAQSLYHIGEKKEALSAVRQSYFMYVLLHRPAGARQVQTWAATHGMGFNTYGADRLLLPLPQATRTTRRVFKKMPEDATYEMMGTLEGLMIGQFMIDAGLTLESLAEGIFSSRGALSKVINGKHNANVFQLEAAMQRVGADIDWHFNTFPRPKDFFNKQKRDLANVLLGSRRYEEAEVLINELKGEKHFDKYTNRQFIESAEASIYRYRHGSTPEFFAMLKKAMKVTKKNFDMSQVATMPLTYYEISLLHGMAVYLCNSPETTRQGLRLFEDLIDSMNHFYVEETAKMRRYSSVLNAYIDCLCQVRRYNEILPLVEIGWEMCVRYGKASLLTGYAASAAAYWLKSNNQNKEKSLAYVAMAHYGDQLLENWGSVEGATQYAKEHFGVEFD